MECIQYLHELSHISTFSYVLIFSTLINTRVTSLYFRHIDFDTTCSLVDKSFLLFLTRAQQNLRNAYRAADQQ
jgi:hypothetical protein